MARSGRAAMRPTHRCRDTQIEIPAASRRRPVSACRSSSIKRPTMFRSPPNRVCHRRWLMTATSGAFGRSSSSLIVRPSIGSTRSSGKNSEETACTAQSRRFTRASQGRRAAGRPCRDAFERSVVALPIEPGRRRDRVVTVAAPRLVHHDQVFAVGIRQRPQQQLIDDGEDRGVGADAEREREDDGKREAGAAPQIRGPCAARRASHLRRNGPCESRGRLLSVSARCRTCRRASSRASASLMPASTSSRVFDSM